MRGESAFGSWLVVALVFAASSAHAQTEADAANPVHDQRGKSKSRSLELGVGGVADMSFGMVCQRESDVEGCETGLMHLGVQLSPRYRILPALSLGGVFAIGWEPGQEGTQGSDGSHTDLGLTAYRFEGEARVHPLGAPSVDPWIGASFGLALLHDFADVYGPGGVHVGDHALTHTGPRGGLAVGLDFRTIDALALSLELRGAIESFGHSKALLVADQDRESHDVGTLTSVALVFGGTFLPAL